MDKKVLIFKPEFHNKLKIFKTFIKSFFLENHRVIGITISPLEDLKVKCLINMGRFIIQFVETLEKIEGFNTEFTFPLEIESALKYSEKDPEKKLKLLITDKVCAYVAGFALPLKELLLPDKAPEVYYELKNYDESTSKKFKDMFSLCTQKENFITIKDNIMYEKLTEYFYHIEKIEFPDTTFAYEDLKMMAEITEDEISGYISAPRWHILKTPTKTVYIMRYALEKIDKEPIYRRTKLAKDEILNIITINSKEVKNLLDILSINGSKIFGFGISKEFVMCGNNLQPYKISSESQLSILKQTFFLEKKELSLILKHCDKEKIRIVTGKDFAIIGNKFFLKMRTMATENKNEEFE